MLKNVTRSFENDYGFFRCRSRRLFDLYLQVLYPLIFQTCCNGVVELFNLLLPFSLRINLDMAKLVYSRFIATDKNIPDTVVRTSTIPEELGRISYLLSDKTGTLTQNEMVFKKLHLGTVSFGQDSMEEVCTYLHSVYANPNKQESSQSSKKTVSFFLCKISQGITSNSNVFRKI